MKILFHDIFQSSNIADELKSPMLSETTIINNQLIIDLDKIKQLNSIGIGNTNGTYFNVIINGKLNNFDFIGNGLYCLDKIVNTSQIIINTDATFIGRIGGGIGCHILTSIAKEPGFNSTNEPRITLSGQVIPGAGGYNYKTISLDSRYKINEYILSEIKDGFKFIAMGYPFFIDLTDESYKLPFTKLYANEKNQQELIFEGGIKKYLYSRRWEFIERF